MDTNYDENLESLSEEELNKLRRFLFEERIRIQEEQKKQQELYEKFLKERFTFMDEMKALNKKVLQERKRLKEETIFFDKKLEILQNGFCQLDMDRKQFEREKRSYRQQNLRYFETGNFECIGFFKGVTSQLGLKKRYKDLMKIFHPDNVCGDMDTVKRINEQYEQLSKKIAE